METSVASEESPVAPQPTSGGGKKRKATEQKVREVKTFGVRLWIM